MSTPDPVSQPPPVGTRDGGPGRRRGVVSRALLALVLGVVIGVLGTVAHRTTWFDLPAGVVLALGLTLSTAVMCRAWSGMSTLLAAAAGWLVAVQVLSISGPGGDVLVPAQPVGLVWSYGGLAVFVVAAFLPRAWFSDQPPLGRARRRRSRREDSTAV